MEEEEGFDHMEEGGFMELLGSGGEEGYLFDAPSSLSSPSSSCYSSLTAAQMLCFGGKEEGTLPLHGVLGQKSSDNSSLSSLSSSPPSPITTNINNNSSSKISKKKVGSGGGRRTTSETTTSAMLSTSKKPKTEGSASAVVHGTIKVRKEKLGDRIMALQQLVSPFGKSDTASVLHEALGYIRFLHDQVQVLSSPYLQGLPSSDHIQDVGESDLRSRGLCLVPISCTEHVTSSNGADLWSPAMGSSKSSSSFKH